MIITLAAALVLGQETKGPSPSALIGKCFARYAEAKTVRGTITWKNTAAGKTITTTTGVQIERPTSRFYIRQVQDGAEPRTWHASSDGKFFGYDKPEHLSVGPRRIVEQVVYEGKPLSVQEMYLALPDSLGDRSAILDIAVANPALLKALTGQWASLEYRGKVKVNDQDVEAIAGKWRKHLRAAVAGRFEMYLSPAGDIVRYVQVEAIADPTTKATVEVISMWDADLKLDTPVDESFFKVVR